MDSEKQYLYPSGDSFAGKIFIALLELPVVFLSVTLHPEMSWRVSEAYVLPMLWALFMLVELITGACVLVKTNHYLYAYQTDKALCISLIDTPLRDAVVRALQLYGPVFERDCWKKFSPAPKSPWPRNIFFAMMTFMLLLSAVSPIYNLIWAFRRFEFPSSLLWAWGWLAFDGLLLYSRLRYRAGIRRFWAWTGGRISRQVLSMELAEESGQVPIIPNNSDGFVIGKCLHRRRIPKRNK